MLEFNITLDERGAEISYGRTFRIISKDGQPFDSDLRFELERFIKQAVEADLLKEQKCSV